MSTGGRKGQKSPLLGAAVLKELLRRRGAVEQGGSGTGRAAAPGTEAMSELYQGVLRDLGVTDAEVEAFLAGNAQAVEEAIRGHGRRGT